MTDTDTTTGVLPQFSNWISDQASGTTDDEMSAALATVTEAVGRLGRKGKVTLDLVIEPAGSSGRNVAVAAKVTAKPPEAEPTPSIYFVGDHGSLHRDDPYQRRMFDDARQVDPETGEIRTLTNDDQKD